ncbi:hypothetical protein JHK82_032004 [Glycine max]|nr:hypothetical protein JHK87_031937 [Glycine soja]KAG4995274.1 hypothetical protein JHK86_032101 [Glycine max]KAG5125267.1 hypothetical protein JHK82_032004 [Glycine max]KAG5146693.1 hypothetical protein JHK84_032236 [Glycine max]
MADDDPQDVADRERIFKHFDSDGDGQVSSQELGDALKALGSVTPEEVQRMMAEIDTDGDGFISHDTDGDGFISHEEFINFARANRGLVRDGHYELGEGEVEEESSQNGNSYPNALH